MRRAALLLLPLIASLSVATGVALAAPQAITEAATDVTATSATLNGRVVTDGGARTYYFEYGTTTAYGQRTQGGTATGGGPNGKDVSETVSGLQPGTTYHFRLVVSDAPPGNDQTFTTRPAGPNDNVLTIAANPRTVTFGRATTLTGRLTGPDFAGTEVRIEQTPFPFTAPFARIGTTTTDAAGNYTFAATPQVNTRYQAEARTRPPVRSATVQVNVRPRVTLRLSDRTPRRGQRVRFSGTVTPGHDGKVVLIQRRTRTGWRTVSTPLLRPATPVNGVARSRYAKRFRVRRSAYYRTVFRPGDGDHVRGKSRRKRARVH